MDSVSLAFWVEGQIIGVGSLPEAKIGVPGAKYSGFPGCEPIDLLVLWRKNEPVRYACCGKARSSSRSWKRIAHGIRNE